MDLHPSALQDDLFGHTAVLQHYHASAHLQTAKGNRKWKQQQPKGNTFVQLFSFFLDPKSFKIKNILFSS